MLLYTDKFLPPLKIGFERFEENELDNSTRLEEQEQEEEEKCKSKVDTKIVGYKL